MPTYDYQCQNCGHEFEKFQSMSASELRKCPQCGKMSLRRLIGKGAGIIFKGSGFYETDYRSDSYKSAAKKDTSIPAEKTETKDAKSETKAESKAAKPSKQKKGKKE